MSSNPLLRIEKQPKGSKTDRMITTRKTSERCMPMSARKAIDEGGTKMVVIR